VDELDMVGQDWRLICKSMLSVINQSKSADYNLIKEASSLQPYLAVSTLDCLNSSTVGSKKQFDD
jgi:hypothetical protein